MDGERKKKKYLEPDDQRVQVLCGQVSANYGCKSAQ